MIVFGTLGEVIKLDDIKSTEGIRTGYHADMFGKGMSWNRQQYGAYRPW